VAKSGSSRRQACPIGIRISRSQPTGTSKRVTNAAPFLHKFSLEVSSVNTTPRESRPLTCIGRRTEILRSARCFEACVLSVFIGRFLASQFSIRSRSHSRLALKEAFHCIKHFAGCPCFVNRSSELASVSNTVRKPASELLHFSHSIRLSGQLDFFVVARK